MLHLPVYLEYFRNNPGMIHPVSVEGLPCPLHGQRPFKPSSVPYQSGSSLETQSMKSKIFSTSQHLYSYYVLLYINTGTTPIRQQYRYPTHLPRTDDRTKLLQLFKENYEVPTTPQLDSRARKVWHCIPGFQESLNGRKDGG